MSDALGRCFVALLLIAVALAGCLDGSPDADTKGLPEPPQEYVGPVEDFSPGWPDLAEAAIRPGAKTVEDTTAGDCTANFVFSTPDNRTLYLGTASHCHIGATLGDPVSIALGTVTGTLVYCAWGTLEGTDACPTRQADDEGWGNDFALVELPEEARHLVHPAMMHWGGPTGLVTSQPGPDEHVLTFGNSSLRDAGEDGAGRNAADATEGITSSPITPVPPGAGWSTFARFASPRIPGDSGSAVILADGTALGVMTQFMYAEGAMRITNLASAIDFLHNNTELRIELKTWETLAEPTLPFSALDDRASRRAIAG